MLIVHDPRCADYGSYQRPEQPARILGTAPYLREQHPGWTWLAPDEEADDATLLLAHTPAHLRRLALPEDFDSDTPALPGMADHARRSVSAALTAAREAVRRKTPAFSLMRPPGHHATADRAMGFCYLNQVAIAGLACRRGLSAWGPCAPPSRIAVWDFDAHHGNGTESLLHAVPDFFFASVHQYPGYPGTGTEDRDNCRNWPVRPRAPRAVHLEALRESWDAVLAFRPDLILVSAGFDAFVDDPITGMTLEVEDFATLGSWLRNTPIPAAAVLEGGYSGRLPQLIDAFLSAWDAGS